MGVRYRVAFLAVGLLGGVDSTYGQCPREGCAAGREVIVEVRVATMRPGFCERILADVKPGLDGLRTLTDREVARFLEAVQGDPRASVMMAPKITAADGQTSSICVTDRTSFTTGLKAVSVGTDNVLIPQEEWVETGTRLTITPKTSADGRFIRLAIDAERKTLAPCGMVPVATQIPAKGTGELLAFTQFLQAPRVNTHKLKAIAVVPVGGSVLIPGPIVEREAQTECRVPVLSEIPYIDRLFTNVGVRTVTEQTVLVITARWVPEPAAALPVAMPATADMTVVWQNRISHLPDPTKGGAMSPGLVGQLFLRGPKGEPVTVDGTLVVDLYHQIPCHDVLQERWMLDGATLERLATTDERFGKCHALFLPWPTYNPKIQTVRLTARFEPKTGKPLECQASSITLQPKPMPAPAPAGKPMLWNGQGMSAGQVMPAGHTERAAAHEIRNVAGLVKAYRRACAAGDKDAAMRYAVQALALDPTCFGAGK